MPTAGPESTPLGKLDLCINVLDIAENFDNQPITGFVTAESVGEVKSVTDGFAIKFDQDIAAFQTCFRRGTSFPHVRETHAPRWLIEVRDAAKVGANT